MDLNNRKMTNHPPSPKSNQAAKTKIYINNKFILETRRLLQFRYDIINIELLDIIHSSKLQKSLD